MKNVSTVSRDVTLGSLGLDSLMVVELRQTLQHYYDISLSGDEIRALTFAKLDQLSSHSVADDTAVPTTTQSEEDIDRAFAESVGFTLHSLCPSEAMLEMNQVDGEAGAPPLFLVHSVDGSVLLLSAVMSQIHAAKVYGLQCTSDSPLSSVSDLASHYIKVASCCLFSFCMSTGTLQYGVPAVLCVTMAVRCAKLAIDFKTLKFTT